MLEVQGLGRDGDYEDVSLQLRAGEVVGLTGLLGSGRTELALSLFGMNPPDRGTIALDGRPHRAEHKCGRDPSRHRLCIRGQAYAWPHPGPVDHGERHADRAGTLAGAFGLIGARARQSHVARWVAELGIKVSNPDNPVKTLSGGNQQRVVLAKWMATNPRVLILDSPTVGVDIGAKDGIYEIIRRLAREGVAVLMISDEIPEVLYHSHRVLVMREGRLTTDVAAADTSEDALRQAVNA